MIKKIVSGCQTGADLGGLEAALECGISTGGTVTKGCRTEDGEKPELISKFNLFEHHNTSYDVRTRANVFHSDGTIMFLTESNSPGTFCTKKAIKDFGRSSYVVKVEVGKEIPEEMVGLVVDWIKEKNISTLNVAGNRESKSPGIGLTVKNFMIKVLNNSK